MTVRVLVVAGVLAVLSLGAAAAGGAANECAGLQVCVPVSGPWVAVPASSGSERPSVEWQLTCPRAHVVGGVDARLSDRAIDVSFLGALGSPVSPGITTSRSVVFRARFVGARGRAPTFRPFIGCTPGSSGGSRVPTSVAVFKPGKPISRRVKTLRLRPGATTVTQACGKRERLVGASHAFGFGTRTPPSASLVASVSGSQATSGEAVVVRVRADAELAGIPFFVQVHAVCTVTR